MSAEIVGVLSFLKYVLWAPLVAVFAYFLKKRDNKIDDLEKALIHTVSKQEAKDMIKEAVQPVRDELGRFQQQMMDKITEIGLTVKQTSDNVTKLSTDFTVQVEVQKVKEALAKQHKEGNN